MQTFIVMCLALSAFFFLAGAIALCIKASAYLSIIYRNSKR